MYLLFDPARNGTKRKEEKRPLDRFHISPFILEPRLEIIKRETCPFPLHPSRGRVMEISRGRLVPFQDRIISSLQNSQIAYATFVGSLQ